MSFADIPIRSNGQDVDASWWNTIRTQLLLAFGDVSGEVPQSIGLADTDQDVTELTFDKADFSKVDIRYWVRRSTDDFEYLQSQTLELHYYRNTNEWKLREGPLRGDDALTTFSIFEDTTGGGNIVTVRYSTLTISGADYVGTISTKWEAWSN